MRIIINRTLKDTQKYSILSSCSIVPFSEADNLSEEDVVAMIEGSDFESTLNAAIGYGVPVIAITTKESVCYHQALKLIHPHGVIYYEDGKILSSEKVFIEAMGLSVKTLVAICEYALENKLYPDIYVWKPQEDIVSFAGSNNQQQITPDEKGEEKPAAKKQSKPKTYNPAQTDLQSYINSCDRIIAVFKTSPSADSGSVASKMAKELNTVYLNISLSPAAHDQKQNLNCAYSDGNIVNYNSSIMPGQYLIVEVDAQLTEALEMIYKAAYKIVHVAADVNESMEPLKAWTGSGFKLDAVIPYQTKDIDAYSNEFPAYSVDKFVKLL